MELNIKGILNRGIVFFICVWVYPLGYAQNNIVPHTADCGGTRPPFAFDVRQVWLSNGGTANSVTTPIVGDMDGDGKTEVLALNSGKNTIQICEDSSKSAYLYEVSSDPGKRPIPFVNRWTVPFPLSAGDCRGVTPVVASTSGTIRRLMTCNLAGMSVCDDSTAAEAYEIPVERFGMYIAKALIGDIM